MTSKSSPMSHSPAQEYSFRVPSPPRVFIPPPSLNREGIPNLQLVADSHAGFESSGFSNAEFLNTVTCGNLITANNMLEWKYEQRRDAQKIVPFLYLGPMTAAKDKDFLIREGITMVLAMRNTQSAHMKLLESRAAQGLGLETLSIDVNGNQELIAAFPKGIEAINAHLSKMYQFQQAQLMQSGTSSVGQVTAVPGKVLVFCESGNERSATMVAAYIMAMYSKDLCTALQIVQAQRFCVALDDPLRELLRTYESILKAKRDVHRSQGSELGVWLSRDDARQSPISRALSTGRSTKRSFDDTQGDVDFDMEGTQGQMDAERFEMRDGHAPFLD